MFLADLPVFPLSCTCGVSRDQLSVVDIVHVFVFSLSIVYYLPDLSIYITDEIFKKKKCFLNMSVSRT